MAGLWGCILYILYILCRGCGLICFLILGITCGQWARPISNDYPELQHPPHPPYLLASLQITTVIGCVAIGWIPLSCYFLGIRFRFGPCVLSVLFDSIS